MKTDNITYRSSAAEDQIITRELLLALRNGSHDAYATVYFHYRKPLELFLRTLLRSEPEVEDILQEMFMKVWEMRNGIDPDKKFRAFLYTAAKNAVMNKLQHQKVRNRYSDLNRGATTDYITQEEVLIAQETELVIELVIGQMPKMRKKVYELSMNERKNNQEIAQILGITKKNVANHLSHAKKDIKNILTIFLFFFV